MSKDGLKYKVFEIEGQKFIGVQVDKNLWTLAGPLSEKDTR